ncbi:exocyst complex family protein, subunit Sec15 [Naegleria gruberi]|uniref:Exocyst complex family protein, subunit Sec15 n=1 Tax=Naegleria gruberi TaxID=5762 RepID=D2W2L7_NAEGR|nr:exocyst complex family protein, subunit Sec15 [Naegleria gruberi]EFC36637.1 exocyst complex family protein, subunit Sec15 [Naegleria gruberi]|eukprot:XP_002669381.1 exocyst complex family protein, subunit Sec15 [Naegleria gruberi strain NEG-M]
MRKFLNLGKKGTSTKDNDTSSAIPYDEIMDRVKQDQEENQQLQQQQHEPLSTGDDFILASLVESGFITGSIKTVYERGKEDTFYESLDNFLDKQKTEIETICSSNYEEFLKSVSQLKSVRSDGKILKKKIIGLDEEVQKAGKEALECGKQLVLYRNIAENIHSALQVVDLCKHVSTLATKVHQQIQEEKYFSALKTLEHLEKSIRTVHKFNFARFIEKQIPIFKRKIKQNVERDFNQWLVNVRNKSRDIGKSMIEMQFSLMTTNGVKYDDFVKTNNFNFTFPNIDIINDSLTVFDILEKYQVELTPVYTCKHIYESMDSYEQFKGYYKRNRTIQLNHEINHAPLLEQKKSDKDTSIYPATVQEWLERIIGFFTVESVTLRTTSSLLSNIELNSMWEQSLQKILTSIDEHLAIRMNNPKEYLNMKKCVLIFSLTASEQLGLHTSLLIDLLAHYRSAFSNSIEFKSISNIEDSDCKQPFTCPRTDSAEYKDLKKYGLMQNPNNYIAFSEIVLTLATEVESFILDYEVYCDRIVSYTTSIKQLKSGIMKLFEHAVKCLDKELNSSTGTGIARYVQVVINYQAISDYIIPYFEDFYGKRVKQQSTSSTTSSSKNAAVSTSESSTITYFKQVSMQVQQSKERGENSILRELTSKCSKLLSFCQNFSFAPEYQGNGVIGTITDNFKTLGNNLGINQQDPKQQMYNEPHQFVFDMIEYLDNAHRTLQYLKQEKKDQIMFSACDSIARYLQNN